MRVKWRMISISLTSGICPRSSRASSPSSSAAIDCRHIQRRQLVRLLAGRRLLEDQAFVLADVGGGFLDFARSFTAPPPSPPRQSMLCAVSLGAAPQRRVAQLRIELLQRESADDLLLQQPVVDGVADRSSVWTTNSLKRGAPSNSTFAPLFLNCSAA